MTKPLRNYEVLVQKRNLKGMRKVIGKSGRTKFTKAEAVKLVAKLTARGRSARMKQIIDPKKKADALIKKWLRGDLDFDRKLMINLAMAARDSKTVLHVNYGKRTYAEQAALWAKYGPPRAARPGTSRHETGLAADVVTEKLRISVGSVKKIRAALKNHGLCLPVPNEPWHVECGSTWRA